ncbi:MAG: hypothetical protein DRN20_02215 [Thermoplasmata archaeon]|nr:MAG: hypothetical protein DRN20_02215 [Thermoplasmata archaeon]
MMKVVEQRIWIHKDEVIDAIEIFEKGKLKYYSYTYKILSKKGDWIPMIRWDNFGRIPHVDKYDPHTGALVEQRNCSERNLTDVIHLVTSFRRNLFVMDLGAL